MMNHPVNFDKQATRRGKGRIAAITLVGLLGMGPTDAAAETSAKAEDDDPYAEAAPPSSSLDLTFDYARKLIASGEPFTLFIHQPAPGSGGRPQVILLVGPAATQPHLGGLPNSRAPKGTQPRPALQPSPKGTTSAPTPTTNSNPPPASEDAESDPPIKPNPAAAAPENAASSPTEPGTEARTSVDPAGRNLLGVALGAGVLTRTFQYSDSAANSANLRSYSLPAMPLFEVSLEAFPAVNTDIAGIRDLGVAMDYAHSLDMESVTTDGTSFNTHSHRWHLGLRYRWLFGQRDQISASADAQYGQQQFGFTPQNTLAEVIANQTPSVDYQLLRLAGQGAYQFQRFQIGAGFAYLGVLDGGEIYNQFRSPTVHGIDLAAHGKVALTDRFALSIEADYRRLFSTFRPNPGDAFVAGGALDQFFYTRLSASYRY